MNTETTEAKATVEKVPEKKAVKKIQFTFEDGTVTRLCFDYQEWWVEDGEGVILEPDGKNEFYKNSANITGYLTEMAGWGYLIQPMFGPKFMLTPPEAQ